MRLRAPPSFVFTAAAALTLTLSIPASVRACATCGVGDPTLTAVGVEQPFAGRIRLSLGVAQLSYRDGEGVGQLEVADRRATLGIAVSPTEWLTVTAFVPFVWREVAYATLARETTLGLGGPELRARFVVFRDRAFAPSHLLSMQAGLRFPTPTALHDGRGALMPLDAQTGTGSFDPIVGLMWSHFGGEFAMHTSAILTMSTEGTGGWRNGPSVRLAWQGQWQPANSMALTLGLDGRIDADPTLQGEAVEGAGAALFVSPGMSIAPSSDTLLWLVIRIPVIQHFGGARADGPIAEIGMALDV